MTKLAIAVATVGYIGYIPIIPGTFGSAAGLLLFTMLRATGSPILEAGVALFTALLGVWAGGVAERHFRAIDPGPVVIDEVLGILITLLFVPVGAWGALTGFVLFRIFDIVKPYPASRMERLAGGLGVMADDVVAAVYAHVVLRMVLWILPGVVW